MGLFGNNDRLNTARYNLEQYEKTKPADYQSKYQGQIKDVMGKLENMGDFDYDPDADAAYQQYKNQYTRQAKLANQNTAARRSAKHGSTLPTLMRCLQDGVQSGVRPIPLAALGTR